MENFYESADNVLLRKELKKIIDENRFLLVFLW